MSQEDSIWIKNIEFSTTEDLRNEMKKILISMLRTDNSKGPKTIIY